MAASPPPPRLAQALADRYRIDRELGSGGMATVFLADDLKHDRQVALKVLKPELAAVIGGERFLSEIRTTARLQHPHILPLFDSGEADGFLYYVMPYVKGESLRDRLDRERQLGVDDAVSIAIAVAQALDYAHREGVVHRDIKPANILLHDGQPVVADFGVALALGAAAGTRLTETGLSVGTPYYMSPEQATGDQAIGPRADIYALGAVLYEMLVGQPPYTGATAQAILGQILRGGATSIVEHRSAVPRHVDAVVRKALEKVPADRFASARDIATALGDPGFRYGPDVEGTPGAASSKWGRVGPVAVGIAAVAAVIAAVGWLRSPAEPPMELYRLALPFGDETVAPGILLGAQADIAPGGEYMVYSGWRTDPSEDPPSVWIKRRDDLEWSLVASIESGISPRISPDGRRIALTGSSLERVDVIGADGRPIYGWEIDGHFGWMDDQTLIGRRGRGQVVAVDLATGDERLLLELDTLSIMDLPAVLPGGEAIVFPVCRDCPTAATLLLYDIDEDRLHGLGPGLRPEVLTDGTLVFARSDGSLWAARLDVATGSMTEGPVQLGPQVATSLGSAGLASAPDGTLLLFTGPTERTDITQATYQPTWITRDGQVTPIDPDWVDQLAYNFGHALSPSGDRLAIGLNRNGSEDIWVKELPDGPIQRVTSPGVRHSRPQWRPGGRELWYQREDTTTGLWVAHRRRADGTGPAIAFPLPDRSAQEILESPDGAWMVFRVDGVASRAGTGRDIVAYRATGEAPEVPVAATEYDEFSPRLSPDGRWLAYVSREAGEAQVFVRPFPDVERGRIPVSVDGGLQPLWKGDGSELYYLARDDEGLVMRVAALDTRGGFDVVDRRTLFRAPPDLLLGPGWEPTVDVTADGERFVVLLPVEQESLDIPYGVVLVRNLLPSLRARLAAARRN